MDMKKMKKLNKQGFIFAVLHTVILFNLAAEFLFLS